MSRIFSGLMAFFMALAFACNAQENSADPIAVQPTQMLTPTPLTPPPSQYPALVSPSEQATVLRFSPPGVDRGRFVPLAEDDRIMSPVKVKYAVRPDGHEFCSRITGIPIRFNSQPMACAFWNVKRRECTIITPVQTGFNYIGHELRHCFEGAFHD
jgi:hypothetical protein